MLLLAFTVLISVVQCSFNPYPRYSEYSDGGDTGEPVFLTEYIEKGEIELAKNLSLVNHDDMKWLTSYAGYLTVNKNYNSNMFFWFFPAKLDQANAPVVLWLQGNFKSFIICCKLTVNEVETFYCAEFLRYTNINLVLQVTVFVDSNCYYYY